MLRWRRSSSVGCADPVTLFGVAMVTTGWPKIEATFDWLAATFSNCFSFKIEMVAASANDDLADLAAFEHTTASIGGAPPDPYTLRMTTIFRREAGAWKIVRRHADSLLDGASTRDRLLALGGTDDGESAGLS